MNTRLTEKPYSEPIPFGLNELDTSKYTLTMIEKGSLRLNAHEKETNIDYIKDNVQYSEVYACCGRSPGI